MKKFLTYYSLILIATLFSCEQEKLQEPIELTNEENWQYFEPEEISEISLRNSCTWIELPAGSENVLAQAVNDVCEGGTIYLRAGMHTETEKIVISKFVKIIGEEGAILKVPSDLASLDLNTFQLLIEPGLHILNAPKTLIQNLEIQPINPDGGTAILFDNSDGGAVIRCNISNFQRAVAVEKSDRITILANTIASTALWQTDPTITDIYGVLIINGESIYIGDNDVSNSLFAIWACSRWGTLERNLVHDNATGILLCTVPQTIKLPDGSMTGSIFPATGWKVRNNNAIDNLITGYLVIDGANNNLLTDNNASNNGQYDIELAGESDRFAITVPGSSENTFVAGAFPNVVIKDCGENNSVNGGILVDNNTDPCF